MKIKRKKASNSNNNTRVAFIILALFIGCIVISAIFIKHKQESQNDNVIYKKHEFHHEKAYTSVEGADAYLPNENVKSVESTPMPQQAIVGAIKNIPGSGGKIAIIIDDWGQTTANCKYLREMPEPLAVSILPGLRHTKDVANCASLYHKLTMLHLPLEAQHNYDIYPPNYIIKTTMDPALVSQIVDKDLAQLPSIEGVNNHMGSKATEDRALMMTILKKLKQRGLFFVDSMTAPHTTCAAVADELGLSFSKRDVFLDNINTRVAITKQIIILAQKARRRGYAVAIGHDRHLTMQVLKEEIPLLETQGFQIVSIKTLLKNK